MRTRSALWDQYITQPHTQICKIEILVDNVVEHTFVSDDSLVVEGQAGFDRTNAVRGSGTFTIQDATGDYVPSDPSDLLAPYGTEFKPYRGIRYPDGTEEYMSLGVFTIRTTTINDSGPGLSIRCEGGDRSEKVSRAKFARGVSIPSGTSTDTAIKTIIDRQVPGYTFDLGGNIQTTPTLLYEMSQDPWEAVSQLAKNAGNELYFDTDGVVVMRPIKAYTAADVVWTFDSAATSTMSSIATTMSTGGDSDNAVFNHVIVTGEPFVHQAPVRAEAFDNDPNSPTYWRGPFGDMPAFYKSNQIMNSTQAQATADALLRKYLGRFRSMNFNGPCNPALEIGDVVAVDRSRDGLNNFVGVVEGISFGLIPTRGMDVTVRQRPV